VAWSAYKYWPFLSSNCFQSEGNGGCGEAIGDAEVAREVARGGIGETLLLLSPIEVLTQACFFSVESKRLPCGVLEATSPSCGLGDLLSAFVLTLVNADMRGCSRSSSLSSPSASVFVLLY